MFDIGWSELVVVGLVALIVIGPKELPTVLRTAGQWMGKVKRMASEFQGQFQEALREAEVADLKEQAEDLTGSLKSITEYDPLADIDKDKEKDDGASEWDEPSFETPEHETPEHEAPAAESATETSPETASAAPVAAVESAPVEALPEIEPPKAPVTPVETAEQLTPAETPPPKQARGSA
jgi:sec-independent protein translocase protein TatB